MLNDNKEDFLDSVRIVSTDFRNRAFEECMNGFLSKCVKQSITLKIPETTPLDTKENIIKESTATIVDASKKLVNNAIKDDHTSMHNVDLARNIVSPQNLSESVQKLLAEHIYNESQDRMTVLEHEFDSGKFNNLSLEDAYNYIKHTFENVNFDGRFENGKNLKAHMNILLSTEGETLVESIKNDVAGLVKETEAKNSVIREAVAEINDTKAKIEEKINGEADPEMGTADDKKIDKKEDQKDSETATQDNASSDISDASGNLDAALDGETSTEGFYNKAVRSKKVFRKSDLYRITDSDTGVDLSTEALSKTFDENSFSRESAEEILKEFRELSDGIDTDNVPENEATMSMDDNEDSTANDNPNVVNDAGAASAEMTYTDDNDEPITIDSEKFKYDEDDEIKPEILTEESWAKDFLPLSFKKFCSRDIKVSNKLSAALVFTPDRGKQFFDSVKNRSAEMLGLLSREDEVCDTISKDQINKQIDDRLDICGKVQKETDQLINDLGILGILDGNYQRTDDPVQNAATAIFKPEVIAPHSPKDAMSKEELHEHELADIFRIAMDLSDVKSELADGVDVIGNRDKLGYLEELLNEKMFELEDVEKAEVESKVKALQSIESIIPLDDLINIQAFMSKSAGTDNRERIKLDSLKNIDAYGFSYVEEVDRIKKDIYKKYKETHGDYTGVNFNVNELVDFVLEEKDTTKLSSNLFEKVLTKFTSNIDITSSTEGLVVYNKAKVLTTAFVTADKLGFISPEEINNIKYTLLK